MTENNEVTNSVVTSNHWQQQVSEWQASNLNAAQWCREQNIVYHKFLYWKRKFEEASNNPPEGFIELTDVSSPITLEVNGIKAHVDVGFDRFLLKDVIHVIKEIV